MTQNCKVFCRGCVYFSYQRANATWLSPGKSKSSTNHFGDKACEHLDHIAYEDSPYERKIVEAGNINILNKNNDCPSYIQKEGKCYI